MMEWSRPASSKSSRLVKDPDSIGGIAQLERTVASAARPSVLITERELSVLRRGLTKDGWKRSLYLQPAKQFHGPTVGAGILSVANRWLETDIAIPSMAGYFHRFFCSCGERLSIPADLLPAEQYSCPACGSSYGGPELDGAVDYLHHNHLAGAALSLAVVYGIEKDRAYAEKAAEILLKYADAYPGSHAGSESGGMFLQSLDESVWAIALAQAYDLIYYSRTLGEDGKQLIEQRLFRQIAESLMSLGIEGSRGAWYLSAVGVIGLAIKDASLVRYALDAFELQMATQLGDDGLWPQSVHTYHFYALAAFVWFAEACYRAGIDLYNWEVRPGKSLRAMFASPLEYAYPSFQLPAIHDGWFEKALPLDLYEIAYRRWGDQSFAWVLKKGYRFGECPVNAHQGANPDLFQRTSFFAFLFGRDLPGRTGAPAFKGADFQGIGICTLRGGDDLMVTLDYGHSREHGHADKLSFTLFANGVVAMPDYGTPGLGSDLTWWSKSTAAHNTVVVDGANQEPSEEHGLVHRHCGSLVQCASAVAGDSYPGVSQTRRIVNVGNACIVVDDLVSDKEHDYDWLVRCEGEPRLHGEYGQADIDTAAYPGVSADRRLSVSDCYSLTWECENGQIGFRLWPELSGATAILGRCPTETTARTASLVMCRQHARNARFVAAMVAARPGEEIEIARDGCVVCVSGPAATDHVYVRGCGDELSTCSLETDGEVAVVREAGNGVSAVALVKGSWIRWNGVPLIECSSPVDCVEFLMEDHGPVVKYSGESAGIVKVRTNARAMRVNGFRATASRSNGSALIRITPQMLAEAVPGSR